MRKACVSQQENSFWDKWFTEMRRDFTSFHNHMKAEGLGLIKGDNQEIFKAVEVHHEDLDEALFDLD